MLSIQFSTNKDDVFEFVGRVTTFAERYEDDLHIKPRLVSSMDSGCVVSFTLSEVSWSWHKAKGFIDTLQHIARNNKISVDVVGVLFNGFVN